MKLYAFESCPFCIRVRMVLGIKRITYVLEYVGAGNIPPQLEGEIDKLSVPILKFSDKNDAKTRILQDSQQIIHYLEHLDNQPMFAQDAVNNELIDLFSHLQTSMDQLCYPRMLSLALPELSPLQARRYFASAIQEKLGMSFDDALQKTDSLVQSLQSYWSEIETALHLNLYIQGNRPLNANDLYAFPHLRHLTMVAELIIPVSIKRYLDCISHQVSVPLFQKITLQQAKEKNGASL